MITGGLVGLLIAVIYTIVTGKLQLAKNRVVYGTPARGAALLGLVPVMLASSAAIRAGGLANMPNGLPIFLGALGCSVALIYAVAWPFGQTPR